MEKPSELCYCSEGDLGPKFKQAETRTFFKFLSQAPILPSWQKALTLGFLGVLSPPPQLCGAKMLERVHLVPGPLTSVGLVALPWGKETFLQNSPCTDFLV